MKAQINSMNTASPRDATDNTFFVIHSIMLGRKTYYYCMNPANFAT